MGNKCSKHKPVGTFQIQPLTIHINIVMHIQLKVPFEETCVSLKHFAEKQKRQMHSSMTTGNY